MKVSGGGWRLAAPDAGTRLAGEEEACADVGWKVGRAVSGSGSGSGLGMLL